MEVTATFTSPLPACSNNAQPILNSSWSPMERIKGCVLFNGGSAMHSPSVHTCNYNSLG